MQATVSFVRLETLPVEEGFARTGNTTGYAGGYLLKIHFLREVQDKAPRKIQPTRFCGFLTLGNVGQRRDVAGSWDLLKFIKKFYL